MVIKTQLCAFSERRIYPGHGTMAVRRDGQVVFLASKKATAMYNQKKKPQKLAWTMAWRRLHKKNLDNRKKRTRTRKVVKYVRQISGLSLDNLKKKMTEKKSKREANRKLQLAEIKERKKKAKAERKAKAKQGGGQKFKAAKNHKGGNR
eukprot:g4716.t1